MVEYFMLMLGGPECLVSVMEKRRFFSGPVAKENGSVARELWRPGGLLSNLTVESWRLASSLSPWCVPLQCHLVALKR
jgi:hypothetical protein